MSLTAEQYLWLKALHIIFVICWMAGMLYLPRLFVYHCQVAPKSEASELFKVMERKLMRVIINPCMIITFILGFTLAFGTGAFAPGSGNGWMHAKLAFVLLLGAIHGMMSKYRKAFERDENVKSERFFRIFNEVPAIVMVVIVLLVVLKPF